MIYISVLYQNASTSWILGPRSQGLISGSNVWVAKKDTKHSSNTLLRLVSFFATQMLHIECSKQFKCNSYFYVCVWAEPAVLGNTKTALKFKYEI